MINETASDDSTTHFIELPDNPYLRPNFGSNSSQVEENLTEEEKMVRRTDPETFLYLYLLKKMKRNSNAKVLREIKKEILSEAQSDFGQLKPLLYRKLAK